MAPRIQDNDEDYYLFDHKQQQTIRENCIPRTEQSITVTITSSTPRTQTQTQTRRVSFGAMATTHIIMGLSDYTPQELEASWYDSNSMHAMKETARSDAKLVDAGLLSEGKDVSIRGLEHRTRQGLKRKRQSRRDAYMSVFFEIDAQIEEDYNNCSSSSKSNNNNNMNYDDYYYNFNFDDELIADAYFDHSEPCAVDAHTIGMQDERIARKIYDEHEPNHEHDCAPLLQFQPAAIN